MIRVRLLDSEGNDARPFLRAAIKSGQARIERAMHKAIKQALKKGDQE